MLRSFDVDFGQMPWGLGHCLDERDAQLCRQFCTGLVRRPPTALNTGLLRRPLATYKQLSYLRAPYSPFFRLRATCQPLAGVPYAPLSSHLRRWR